MKTVTKTWLVALAAAILLSSPSAPAEAGGVGSSVFHRPRWKRRLSMVALTM